jgi:translocation and assembly module TamB
VGQITVDRARYTRRLNWKTYPVKARTAQKPKRKLSRFERAKLNIKINGSKDITIDNNFAKTELEVDLLLRGTVSSPILFGRIETDKGSVFFRNNDFEIIRASADFVDPEEMNPYLDINAETSIQGYSIRVALEGQIPNLDLSLVSDPPLDETDILGLLTHGEVGSELGGLEAGIGTAEATSFMTGEYQDVIEERLTRLTGLDRFEVEPYASGRTRKIGPRVSVSKRLIEDKLYVTYTSSVGVAEEDDVKLEYRLNRNVSLIGENDETGSLGADIKFRFEFK